MRPANKPGPRTGWNGVGLGLVAFAVVLFVLFAPARPAVEDTTPRPPTISLDDLSAMLADAAGEPPATVQVETPDGPVIVAIPATTTTTPERPTEGGTPMTPSPPWPAPATTTTDPPPPTYRPPDEVQQDILDDLGTTTTATPEGEEQ